MGLASYRRHDDVMFPVELNGRRAGWREITVDDAEVVVGWQSVPEIFTYIESPEGTTLAGHRQLISGYVEDGQQLDDRRDYSLALTVDGQLAGTGGIHLRDGDPSCAELGYLLHPDHWGKGIATEAAGLLLRFAFDTLRLHRVEALTRPDNLASRRVLEKIGMTREGLRRQDVHLHGRWHDSLLFAILETDPVPAAPLSH